MSRKSIFVTLLVILSQSGFLLAQKTKGVVSNSDLPCLFSGLLLTLWFGVLMRYKDRDY